MQVVFVLWLNHFNNCINLLGVRFGFILSKNMAKTMNFMLANLALFLVYLQIFFAVHVARLSLASHHAPFEWFPHAKMLSTMTTIPSRLSNISVMTV